MTAGMAMLILDRTDFKSKMATRDKESHYRKMKRSIQQENISIINTYAMHPT